MLIYEAEEGVFGVNLQNLRWSVIVMTIGVTLAVLFGGGYLIRMQAFDQPLERALRADSQVASVQLLRDGNVRLIQVKLKETGDLEGGYTSLDKTIRRQLKAAPFQLVLEDRRTAELEQLLKRSNLHVQEALVTGAFAQSADRVAAEAARFGAEARLTVDGNRVYLELRKQDAYLYSVTDRRTDSGREAAKGVMGL